MKRTPEFGNEPEQPSTDDWLQEWLDEQKLTPVAAHELLRSTFTERLVAWREAHPGEDSWVIPFHYTHEDGDFMRPMGALWVPSDGVQEVVNRAGAYIHMSAVMDMESHFQGTGMDIAPFSQPSRMDLQGETPVVPIMRDMLLASMLREQVERDFAVRIEVI